MNTGADKKYRPKGQIQTFGANPQIITKNDQTSNESIWILNY